MIEKHFCLKLEVLKSTCSVVEILRDLRLNTIDTVNESLSDSMLTISSELFLWFSRELLNLYSKKDLTRDAFQYYSQDEKQIVILYVSVCMCVIW